MAEGSFQSFLKLFHQASAFLMKCLPDLVAPECSLCLIGLPLPTLDNRHMADGALWGWLLGAR